jgi:hypothetical protein
MAATRGFGIVCPFCNDEEAEVVVRLNEIRGKHPLTCLGCEWEGTAEQALAEAESKAAAWRKVVRWMEWNPDAE